MRRALSLAMAGLFVLLVSAAQAQAEIISFTATLNGGNEVPPVVTGAAGTATITYDTVTGILTYRVEVYNMPTGTTAGHFHVGAVGVAGPTVINFTVQANISNDFAIAGTATSTNLNVRAAQGINSWDDLIQALLLNNLYINVHSTANPGGELRGQVIRVVP